MGQPEIRAILSFQRRLLRWYGPHQRRFPWRNKSASNYAKIIAEVLLQRTRAETVATFYPAFLRQFPSWKALAQADERALQTYLQPIGLWRRRASTLVNLAQEMVRRRSIIPRERSAIEALPGIGQYIANAVQLLAHGVPRPLLDVNMARVLERHFGPRQLVDIRYDPYLQDLSYSIVQGEHAVVVNWAILDLAATTCRTAMPACHECPLRETCQHAARLSL
jgi:A/G-specific adenine glycosylase